MAAPLSQARLGAIVEEALRLSTDGAPDAALVAARPLLDAQAGQLDAAGALVHLLGAGAFPREQVAEVAAQLLAAHADVAWLVGELGSALERVRDLRYLNAAPPQEPVFEQVAARLRALLERPHAPGDARRLLSGLATASRCLGRSGDADAERCFRRLVELEPDRWQRHYDLGLFYKTRGRFQEGLAANQRAAALGGADEDGVRWNLGICATGAGAAEEALRVWEAIGQRVALGRFGLPEGRYAHVKVRLAERPLAERDAGEDDPGQEETIWVERLSPCHGIVRSALFHDLGTDYGDVVLFDGAPIVHHTVGDREVPVFPHLATLVRPGYRVFRFAGTQRAPGQLAAVSERLPLDAVVYVHSEQVVQMCARCWENPGAAHAAHPEAEHRLVSGKVCAPPELEPGDLRRALDEALAGAGEATLLVPDLTRLAGDDARAEVEERRWSMMAGPSRHG